jgi:hypothetical protein
MGLGFRALAAVGTALFLTVASSASAQVPAGASPQLRSQYDTLFQRILADPANLDANFQFAEVATQLGDLEAAIGALERIIFYNPDLPRVRLELGILYFRLGSYSMAQQYFESAIAGPGVPAEVTFRVRAFLAEIERRTSVTQWTFFGQVGLRHQSNASAGPSSPLVRALGFDATLDRRFLRRADWNAFALATLRHLYDFENQRGDVWETNVTTYNTRQFELGRLNVNLLEVQTGPRLALAPESWPGASIRPYAVASAIWLGDAFYLGTVGGGVSFGLNLGAFAIEPFAEVRHREFESSREYRAAPEQTGTLWTVGAQFGSPLVGPIRWQSRVAYSRNDTERTFGFYAYEQALVDLAFPIEFVGPWGHRPWILTPQAGFTWTDYEDPNPLVDPNIRREDQEWRVGAALDVPVYQNIGFGVQVIYSETESSLRNFRNDNLAVSFGPTVRF